jgi:uncharacterized protein with HEPN domain
MSKREPKLLVSDILESAQKILDYPAGQRFEDFTKDSKTVDAVIRNFEIIGEAANRLVGFPFLVGFESRKIVCFV